MPSAFTMAIRRANPPLTFKRAEGPLRVDGPAYGAFHCYSARSKGVEFMLLANTQEEAEEILERLGIAVSKHHVRKVAVVQSKNLRRLK